MTESNTKHAWRGRLLTVAAALTLGAIGGGLIGIAVHGPADAAGAHGEDPVAYLHAHDVHLTGGVIVSPTAWEVTVPVDEVEGADRYSVSADMHSAHTGTWIGPIHRDVAAAGEVDFDWAMSLPPEMVRTTTTAIDAAGAVVDTATLLTGDNLARPTEWETIIPITPLPSAVEYTVTMSSQAVVGGSWVRHDPITVDDLDHLKATVETATLPHLVKAVIVAHDANGAVLDETVVAATAPDEEMGR